MIPLSKLFLFLLISFLFKMVRIMKVRAPIVWMWLHPAGLKVHLPPLLSSPCTIKPRRWHVSPCGHPHVSGWMFLLVLAQLGSTGQMAVKGLLLLCSAVTLSHIGPPNSNFWNLFLQVKCTSCCPSTASKH